MFRLGTFELKQYSNFMIFNRNTVIVHYPMSSCTTIYLSTIKYIFSESKLKIDNPIYKVNPSNITIVGLFDPETFERILMVNKRLNIKEGDR